MADRRVVLRPMTEDEFVPWRTEAVDGYAHDVSRATGRPLDSARARAAAQFEELLPDGLRSPDTHVLVVEDDGGTRVGILWLGPHPGGADHAYIYDIVIDENLRGQGLGRATMLAAEDFVKEHGKTTIGLSVFGFNANAEGLYRSLDYEVVATQMRKTLD